MRTVGLCLGVILLAGAGWALDAGQKAPSLKSAKWYGDGRAPRLGDGQHVFVVEFWAADTSAGKDIKVSEFKANSLVTNTINASIELPRDWPTGLYRLDVKVDGEKIGSHEYEVAVPE